MKVEEMKKVYIKDVRSLKEALEKATVQACDRPQHYVAVPDVDHIKSISETFDPSSYEPSIMVCGPRGVGKSTIMQKAFEDKKGVIHVQPDPVTVDNFYAAILGFAMLKESSINKRKLVLEALKEIEGRKPTLVVEINEKCGADHLMALLVELKKVVSESRLANYFIVVSTSRASLLVPMSMDELRVQPMFIKDPPPDVIERYLDQVLSPYLDATSQKKLTKLFIEELGTTFLDVSNAGSAIRLQLERGLPPNDVLLTFISRRKKEYQEACSDFLKMMKDIDKREQKRLLAGIVNGTLHVTDLADALKNTKQEFLDRISKLHPHPLYSHPSTQLVTVGNFVAQNEFKKYIKLN